MIGRLVRRFLHQTRAVAAVEFAIVLPLMLALYIGAVEVSTLITADRRVTTIAGTIGDLVSRRNASIETARLDDYFAAAEAIIAPYSTDTLTQLVSFVRVAADGRATVIWSRGFNGATPRGVGSDYPLALNSEMNRLARGGYLVAAEVSYAFSPYLGLVMEGPFHLYQETLQLPRFASLINLT